MNKSTILYTPIGYVRSDREAIDFSKLYVPQLIEAKKAARADGLPMKFSLKTTLITQRVSPQGVSPNGEIHFDNAIRALGMDGIPAVVDYYESGPTHSLYTTLFDQKRGTDIGTIVTSDIDQFPVNRNIHHAIELAAQMREADSMIGVGSRDVRITLAANPQNDYLKRIFEGYMNIAVRCAAQQHGRTPPTIQPNNQDAAYADHGDFITGAYAFRTDHSDAYAFSQRIKDIAKNKQFVGYEGEYLMVTLGATITDIISRTMSAVPNPMSGATISAERNQIIKTKIREPLQRLRDTPAQAYIRMALLGGDASMGKHYAPELLREVSTYMTQAIEGRR